MSAYYNDVDPYCCEWARNLIKAGLVPDGEVDERSITDVAPDDLRGFTQCHFFCGILGWPYALRLAGWPDDRPVWSGSAPCQPFSVAGKGLGTADSRHLWPEMRRLIEACHPPVVFGEQVSSAEVVGSQLEASFLVAVQAGDYARANKLAKRLARSKTFHYWRRWADGVRADFGGAGYSWGHAVLGAHSVGAPHIRQRLYWVADRLDDACGAGLAGREGLGGDHAGQLAPAQRAGDATGGIPDAERGSRGPKHECTPRRREAVGAQHGAVPGSSSESGGGVSDADGNGPLDEQQPTDGRAAAAVAERGPDAWGNAWLPCLDGRWRRVEPGSSPLAARVPRSVGDLRARIGIVGCDPGTPNDALREARRYRKGSLRGYGNAIVPQVAATFISAYMEAQGVLL